jgi:MFS family permease
MYPQSTPSGGASRALDSFRQHWPEALILTAIMLLAGGLRLVNGAANPGWYADEATHLVIARSLMQGEVRYLAVTDSVLLFARPPLFGWLLAGVGHIAGLSMGTLRACTGLIGTLTVGVLYAVTRRMTGQRGVSLLAALALAILPQAVLYSRFGFSYNLLAPLILLVVYGLYAYHADGRISGLMLAALAAGIGLLGDVFMLTVVPLVLLIALLHPVDRWRRGLLVGLIIALPGALYAGGMLLTAPEAFLFDLRFTLGRLGSPLDQQIPTLIDNLTVLLLGDAWFALGMIGLLALRPARLRGIALVALLLPVLLMGRTVALYSLSAYYLIPLLPLVALGIGALLAWGIPLAVEALIATLRDLIPGGQLPDRAGRGIAWLCLMLLIGLPLAGSTIRLVDGVTGRLPTAIDPFLVDPADAAQAAAYLDTHAGPDDRVIASPVVAALVTGSPATGLPDGGGICGGGDSTPARRSPGGALGVRSVLCGGAFRGGR